MVEKHPVLDFFSHTLLALGVVVIVFPIYLALVGSTHSAQDMAQSPIPIWFGQDVWYNYRTILLGEGPGVTSQVPVARMMWVSLVTALTIAFGKIVISLLSAFAIVYFNFPFRKAVFWGIFITLMLPVEVRIVPTYQVVADFGMVNSFAGLTIPLIASATATFLFRQFFLTVPDELTEAAKMDGASPMRFFWDVLLPLSRTSIAALFVIQLDRKSVV
jgi:sn-glycerol 3-phosphate transport system permease protein